MLFQIGNEIFVVCGLAALLLLALTIGLGAIAGYLADQHGKMWERKLAKKEEEERKPES